MSENKQVVKLSDKAIWLKQNYDATKHVPYAQYLVNQRVEQKSTTIEEVLSKIVNSLNK